MGQIKSTSNYSIFKKLANNRQLDEHLVRVIMMSIKTSNLLEFNPIHVNNKMEVIDGQHRLEACKRLKEPIWYEEKDIAIEHLHLLQNRRLWTNKDYLHYWISLGKEEYIKFKAVMDKYDLSVDQALKLSKYVKDGQETGVIRIGRKFRDGKIIAPIMEEVRELLEDIREIIAILNDRMPPGREKVFITQRTFFKGLVSFLGYEQVDRALFKKQILRNIIQFSQRHTVREYVDLFLAIYNKNSRAKIDLRRSADIDEDDA